MQRNVQKNVKPRKKRVTQKLIFRTKVQLLLIAGIMAIAALIASLFIIYPILPSPQTIPEISTAENPPIVEQTSPQPPQEIVQNSHQQTPREITQQSPPQTSQRIPQQLPKTQQQPQQTPQRIVPASIPERVPEVPEPPSRGKLVFVIDDAGNNLRELEPFLRFPGPITIAVLPGLTNSVEAANRVRASGKELFLHQPMESIGGSNPGPGAVFSGMSEDEIRYIVNRNLDELWPVAGMNNHEGSRVTMDERIMEIILDICRERGIIFLDSRTIAASAAPAVSNRLGLPIRVRDVFLDNQQDRNSIMRYLNTGKERAEQKGYAIMIGHTWSTELAPLLNELHSRLITEGFTFSTVTELDIK